MAQNFFNALGMADLEKVHSQFIYWFFNLDSGIVTDKEKDMLLRKFLGDNMPTTTQEGFKAETEKENIDIIIRASDDVFIIENKLKSSEHDKQTLKYDGVFSELQKKERETYGKYEEKQIHKIYLTLIGEKPENSKWVAKTYFDLAEAFKDVVTKMSNQKSDEYTFIKVYSACITELSEKYSSFIKNPENKEYKNVFAEKQPKGEKAPGFITENGLETIFQKGFLMQVKEKFEKVYKDTSSNIEIQAGNNGNASSFTITFPKPRLDKNGNKYVFDFQYQGGTCKIAYAIEKYADYKTEASKNNYKTKSEKRKAVAAEVQNKIEKEIDVFKRIAKSTDGYKCDKSNMPKSKERISMSNNTVLQSYQGCITADDFCKKLGEEFENARRIIEKLKNEILQISGITELP
ncbi:hypothetical protein FACS1894109_18470 [Spirochaetia bacterium]|nr:hypothetical protein FACS1894109_18470 [Spirochaetia bacterium]